MALPREDLVTCMQALERLYAKPIEASVAKEIDHINAEYRALIAAAPFVTLATCAEEGARLLAARRRAGLRTRA
jgi:predicted pyridoxine 5'-phosphate oxidase superfamily flavin-nucleotide-binding protein